MWTLCSFSETQYKMSSVTSEEFLWSCELSAAKKDYEWAPEVILREIGALIKKVEWAPEVMHSSSLLEFLVFNDKTLPIRNF